MKKVMLCLSVALFLLCTIICCSKEKETKIPECIKKNIDNSICRVDEYCSIDDTKSIYVFFDCYTPPIYLTMAFDENCNFFFIEQEGSPWHALYSEGFALPDGTIEYREDIYHFNRIVFKQN